jgi:hypothetical protein
MALHSMLLCEVGSLLGLNARTRMSAFRALVAKSTLEALERYSVGKWWSKLYTPSPASTSTNDTVSALESASKGMLDSALTADNHF